MVDLVVLLITASVLSLLGLLVLLRNVQDITSKLFALLTSVAILWSATNYLTNHITGYQAQLFINKLSLAVGFLLIQTMWLLSLYFPQKIAVHRLQRRCSLFLTPVLIAVTLFTNGIVASVAYRPEKNITDITIGNVFYFYVVVSVLFFAFLINNFYKSYKSKALTQLQHQQVLYTSIGFLMAFVWALLTAAVIPAVTNSWEISKYGSVGTVFMVAAISFAIIRHKLFDIRLVVARSLAYVLSLGSIGLVAFTILFGISTWLENAGVKQVYLRAFYVLIAVLLAIAYPSMKRFFGRLTNRLFYRDAYETQDLLNDFNQAIVSTIEIDKLLANAARTIQSYLKPAYCSFVLNSNDNQSIRLLHISGTKISNDVAIQMRRYITKTRGKIIPLETLDKGEEHLKAVMQNIDAALIVRITKTTNLEGVGYILMGYKKSGTLYNSQDTAAMEIIANELAIAIENALRFEEIQNFAKTLQEKVDDATRKLRLTNEKLRQLDQTKDDFISMASHQLRTPLTSVKGYVSMVLDEDAGKVNPQQRKLLDQAFISSQRMVYLIADLLNVSRLKTGKFIIEAKPTNLAEVVESELEQLKETAKGRDLKLLFQRPKSFPSLNLDETKIRQVIMNFSDNAIYYTPAGGTITVGLVDKPESVELTVSDNGIGVPKTEQHHLFTKFYRAGNAKKARPDGTGLGLFMAQKVIVAQGGAIIFHSEENKGSTFGFSFPKAKLLVK
jgi:signal transduction histidine kinase